MNQPTNKNHCLDELLNHFGGIPGLANALGIDRHAIYQWQRIPKGRAYQIEVLTKGKFRADCLEMILLKDFKG